MEIALEEKVDVPISPIHRPRELRISTSPHSIFSVINPLNSPLVTTQSRNKWLKIQILFTILSISILAFVFWRKLYLVLQIFLHFIAENPITGSIIVFAIYVIFPVLCIPISFVAVSCGFIYYSEFGTLGLVLICCITWIGTCMAATISFWAARYLATDCMRKLSRRSTKFKIIQQLAKRNGFKVVAVFRLTLIIPFIAVNYILGTTKINTKSFMLGHVTLIPRSIVYPLLGSTIGRLSDAVGKSQSSTKNPIAVATMVIGSSIAVIAFVAFGVAAKREFNRLLNEVRPDDENETQELQPV